MNYITLQDAATQLGVPRNTARKWLRSQAKRVDVGTGHSYYLVPLPAVLECKAALAEWHSNPILVSIATAQRMIGAKSPAIIWWLIRTGKLRAVKPPLDKGPMKVTIGSIRLYLLQRRAGVPLTAAAQQLGLSRQRAVVLLQQGRLDAVPGVRPIRVTQQSIDQEVKRRTDG